MTYRSLCQNYPFDDAMKYLELEKVVGSLHFQQAAQPSLLDVCFLALGVDSSIFFFLFISHLNLPLLVKFSPLLVYL